MAKTLVVYGMNDIFLMSISAHLSDQLDQQRDGELTGSFATEGVPKMKVQQV
jgi:hypothetical protein